jgi:hypothetical protein
MASIWLWWGVGVGLVGVLGLPCGLPSSVCSTTSCHVRDIIKRARGGSVYFMISSLYV